MSVPEVAAAEITENGEDHGGTAAGPPEPADTWIQCDKCQKWRRIAAADAALIGEDDEWHCERNKDPAHASCDVPQELTDAEIDNNQADAAQAGHLHGWQPYRGPQIWRRVMENTYLHRRRHVQDPGDVIPCHCVRPRPDPDTGVRPPGCGPQCVNRMLLIECCPDHCPCEECCSNQSFQRKEWVKTAVRRAGGKGFGLFADEDIAMGQFVIEYVGEVVHEREYDARKRRYLDEGQRHFYFMNVGNGEVIDACTVGNVGRYLNHSCDPNCVTQKWQVRGELAIGLFASRDIRCGEEITFDYNFERYGDKPIRCLCGTAKCRGFIGEKGEVVQGVEFAEMEDCSADPEPIVVDTDAELMRELEAHGHPAFALYVEMRAAEAEAGPGGRGRGRARKERAPGRRKAARDTPRDAEGSAHLEDSDGGEEDAGVSGGESDGQTRAGARRREVAVRKGRTDRPASPDHAGRRIGIASARDTGMRKAPSSVLYSWQAIPRDQRKSEVARRLEPLLEPSGGLRDPRSTEELLSLFNLCEISRNFSASREVRTDGAGNNARAPTRDMLLLLGAVKSTRHRKVQEEMVRKGILRHLAQLYGKLLTPGVSSHYQDMLPLLRLCTTAIGTLPLTREDADGVVAARDRVKMTLSSMLQFVAAGRVDWQARNEAVEKCKSLGLPPPTMQPHGPSLGATPPPHMRPAMARGTPTSAPSAGPGSARSDGWAATPGATPARGPREGPGPSGYTSGYGPRFNPATPGFTPGSGPGDATRGGPPSGPWSWRGDPRSRPSLAPGMVWSKDVQQPSPAPSPCPHDIRNPRQGYAATTPPPFAMANGHHGAHSGPGMDNGAGADPRRGQGYGQAQAYGQGQRWDEQRTGESAHARDAWGASGPGPRPDSRHDSRPSVWEVGGALGAGWHGASIATEAQEGRKRPRDEAERGESEGRGWMTRDVRYNGSVATDAAMGGVTADEGARVEGRGVHGVGANGVAGNGALRNPWETLAEAGAPTPNDRPSSSSATPESGEHNNARIRGTASGGVPGALDVAVTFSNPGNRFESWLEEVAGVCVSKYLRDGLMEESRAKVVLAKVTGKILASERAAYQDRSGRGAAAAKAISGQKVAAKLYEMVAQYAKQK